MSGLEVAGVVLGSLPLVISALEHYASGVHTAKRYWRYKSELRSLILQIQTERGIFINTLEQLLGGVVRIEHMTEFLANPGGEAWKDAGVDQKLRERLRSAHEIYLGNVSGMNRSLEAMMVKLQLGSDGKPQFTDPNLFKQEYKRLKFSLSKSEYADQLSDLRNHNQALTRLTKQSLELEPSRTETKARACPNFNALQNYARSLFHTLRAGLQCQCDGHAVKLRLESRNHRSEAEEDLLQSTQFRVIFTFTAPAPAKIEPWKEANIRWIADKPQSVPLPSCTTTSYTAIKTTRRVRFDRPQDQANSAGTTITVTEQQAIIAAKSLPSHIPSLCLTIGTSQSPPKDACAGYLLDSFKRKHGIYLLDPPVCSGSQPAWPAYTLRQVLTKQSGFKRRLTLHDKLRVAVDLASSILQLYKTPWLKDNWSDSDVYFVHRPGAPVSTIYQHPFIYRKLSTRTSSAATTRPQVQRVIRNETLFTLGVLLIELVHGLSIEELQTPPDLQCAGTPGVVWCTAERLINEEEIALDVGAHYSEAVRRCIRCDFNRKNVSLDDQEFQQAVYEGVVAPLEKTLQHFNGQD